MIEIVPAIDIIDGKCVRLSQGDYNQKKIYNENPLEVALAFEGNGLRRLHLVDLDGAKSKHVVNQKVLETIRSKTSLTIDFGGGIKTNDDIESVFNAGAHMATIGSIAYHDPALFLSWVNAYGSNKIILGADVKDNKIAVTGWLENTDKDLFDFTEEYHKKGVKNLLCTDISKDGMLCGTALELYIALKHRFPELYIIASGGISETKEIEELEKNNIDAAIIGKAIYEGKIALKDLREFVLSI
ncbi:MAG: 1-(5-phosphoribosyl)-5-[(5-phosphoribosylamino)methylideneamino]imidazole-4-carboxamide isomerase [Bacteroidales bacterium]|nr:1-(5-phosphoribosyl)-5-[(5-phosphoribosylamino)methylideneamino]imidazole-4-carboxamide isomerase [Bacteroidales bacterium]